jgi:hypothetical protein
MAHFQQKLQIYHDHGNRFSEIRSAVEHEQRKENLLNSGSQMQVLAFLCKEMKAIL